MKRVRILLLFILFFLVGGTAYAQSVQDKAPVDQPKIQQEAVSTPRENKIETSQATDTATKKESAELVQEKPSQEGLDSEKRTQVEEKSEKDGLKEDAAEVPAEKDSLKPVIPPEVPEEPPVIQKNHQ